MRINAASRTYSRAKIGSGRIHENLRTFGKVLDQCSVVCMRRCTYQNECTQVICTKTALSRAIQQSEIHQWICLKITVRAPVFGRHQFFGTSELYGKAHGSLLSGWMNYNYTACCWFTASSNILVLPSQFWQIRFESYWLLCSKCRILVLLRYV